jgi:ribosomal protein S18 acetylase RimI-like enzyme
MEISIRQMTPDDYDTVYALWLATPGMGLNTADDSRGGIEKFLRRNPNTCFVAESGAGLAGVILCGHDGRRGHIHHTAVAPGERGRGLGRALVARAMDALRDEGINKATLVAFADNAGGNAFWEKLGFAARDDLTIRNAEINPLAYINTSRARRVPAPVNSFMMARLSQTK